MPKVLLRDLDWHPAGDRVTRVRVPHQMCIAFAKRSTPFASPCPRSTSAQSPKKALPIARAKVVGFDSGGHTWVGHDDEVMTEIVKLVVPPIRP